MLLTFSLKSNGIYKRVTASHFFASISEIGTNYTKADLQSSSHLNLNSDFQYFDVMTFIMLV